MILLVVIVIQYLLFSDFSYLFEWFKHTSIVNLVIVIIKLHNTNSKRMYRVFTQSCTCLHHLSLTMNILWLLILALLYMIHSIDLLSYWSINPKIGILRTIHSLMPSLFTALAPYILLLEHLLMIIIVFLFILFALMLWDSTPLGLTLCFATAPPHVITISGWMCFAWPIEILIFSVFLLAFLAHLFFNVCSFYSTIFHFDNFKFEPVSLNSEIFTDFSHLLELLFYQF